MFKYLFCLLRTGKDLSSRPPILVAGALSVLGFEKEDALGFLWKERYLYELACDTIK